MPSLFGRDEEPGRLEVGQGTAQVIELAARRAVRAVQVSPSPPPAAAATATAPTIRVLALEPDPDDFDILQDLLARAEGSRFILERATTAETALERLIDGGIGAVLLAEHAGGQGAIDVARQIRGLGLDLPLLMLGTTATPGLEVAAVAADMADYLDKDELDVERLERAIILALVRGRREGSRAPARLLDQATAIDRLEHAIAASHRRGQAVAFLLIGLEPGVAFRQSRRVAALALRHVCGRTLLRALRATDTVSAWDEAAGSGLAVVLEGLRLPADATGPVQKLWGALAAPGQEPRVPPAAGIWAGAAVGPLDGNDAASLIAAARQALRRVRQERPAGGIAFADSSLDWQIGAGRALDHALRAEPATADAHGLGLRLQAQLGLRGPLAGLALSPTWLSATGSPLAGADLLALARACALGEAMGDWLLAVACRTSRDLAARGLLGGLHLAVPAPATRGLRAGRLASRVARALAASGAEPGSIELELEEHLVSEDLRGGGHGLRELRALGVRLAAVGFADGDGSLRSLWDAPLTTLKLRAPLAHGAMDDPRRRHCLRTLVGLARRLGLRVVAMGSEAAEEVEPLRVLGFDAVESSRLQPPLPIHLAADWLAAARQPPGGARGQCRSWAARPRT